MTPEKGPGMQEPTFEDHPPESDRLTAYDERNIVTYLRLLDAAKEGADWEEAVSIIFQLDPAADPKRAKLMYDSHLARARWLTESGYRDLLRPSSV